MSESQPLVSIVTPCRDGAAYLPDLLACVESQSYPAVEHVVVDGGSKDGSVQLLADCDTARHTIHAHSDTSMYDGLNYGIERSHGELVACLNVDDMYFPDTVEAAVAFMSAHPDVDIAYGDQLTLYPTVGSFDFYIMENAYSDPWGKVLVYFSQPAVFVRRAVFERVGLFDASLKAAGDFDFWYRAFRSGVTFGRIPRILTMVRMHGGNLSLSARWQEEHGILLDRYLPRGAVRVWAERYRLLKRRMRVNQLTLPVLARYPRRFVHFSPWRYVVFLVARRETRKPILTIDLPYFSYTAHRALCFHESRS